MSTSTGESSLRGDRAGVNKANGGWAAFDLKQRRKKVGLSPETDTEPYPTLSGAVSRENLFKNQPLPLERPFSSVLSASVNFPSLTSNRDSDKKTVSQFRITNGDPLVVREDERGINVVELCKRLTKLHPWADESLIKDVMTGVSNDFHMASSLLEAMVLSENKEVKKPLVESNYDNSNASLSLAGGAVSFGGITGPQGSNGLNKECLNESRKEMIDNHTSFGKMLPCDGKNSSSTWDAAKNLLLEPEWEEDDLYFIHRKDAVRMMRSALRHSKAANDAYLRGDHLSAQHFSLKAREEWRAAEDLNATAAKEILRIRNTNNDQWTLDLHGLHAGEAVQALQEHLHKIEDLKSSKPLAGHDAVNKEQEKLQRQPVSGQRRNALQVITGKGNNSKGAAALPPAIRNFLIENRYRFDEARPGVITVALKFRPQ